MFKSQFISDLTDGEVGGRKFFLGKIDQLVVQMLLCALASQGFKQATEVARRNIQRFGNLLHAGQALSGEGAAVEIAGQEIFQARQQFMAGDLAGDELALVEPLRIGQQEFQLRNDYVLAEPVDISVVFLFDLVGNGSEHCLFLIRQVKRLVYRIAEKLVLFDGFRQRCAP